MIRTDMIRKLDQGPVGFKTVLPDGPIAIGSSHPRIRWIQRPLAEWDPMG